MKFQFGCQPFHSVFIKENGFPRFFHFITYRFTGIIEILAKVADYCTITGFYRSPVSLFPSHDTFQECRFPCAVRPYKPNMFAAFQFERNIFKNAVNAEIFS